MLVASAVLIFSFPYTHGQSFVLLQKRLQEVEAEVSKLIITTLLR